jgi:hypothetical protein
MKTTIKLLMQLLQKVSNTKQQHVKVAPLPVHVPQQPVFPGKPH